MNNVWSPCFPATQRAFILYNSTNYQSNIASLVHTIEFFSKEGKKDSEVDGAFTLGQHGI